MTNTTTKLLTIGAVAAAGVVLLTREPAAPVPARRVIGIGDTNRGPWLMWDQDAAPDWPAGGWRVETAPTPLGPWSVATNVATNVDENVTVLMAIGPGFYRVAAMKRP